MLKIMQYFNALFLTWINMDYSIAHLFTMDAMMLSIILQGILFHSLRSAISMTRTIRDLRLTAIEHVPNMIYRIHVRRVHQLFHKLYCLSFKHALIKTRCGLTLTCWKTKKSRSVSLKKDILFQYLVYIAFFSIPNHMKVRASNYCDSTRYHQTTSYVL